MKPFIGIALVIGMFVFQSSIFSINNALFVSIAGVVCFIGLIVWLFRNNKKKGADPALMLNQVDDID